MCWMRWKGLLSQGKRRMDEGTKARLFLGAKSVDEPTKDAKFVSVDDSSPGNGSVLADLAWNSAERKKMIGAPKLSATTVPSP